jgi:hypothetical protein
MTVKRAQITVARERLCKSVLLSNGFIARKNVVIVSDP